MESTRRTPLRAEGGIQNVVAAGERTGVRSRGLGGLRGASRLDDDDRLGPGDFARGAEEAARIADRLHVSHDRGGARIVAEVGNQIAPAHVQHGTNRDERAETNHRLQRPIQHGGTERAALADERQVSGTRHGMREGGVEAGDRVHYAQAVGADQTHFAADGFLDLALVLQALLAHLFEAGGDDDGGGYADSNRILNQGGHGVRRSGDYDEIGTLGKVVQTLVGANAEDVGALGVHRVDGAAKWGADQIAQNHAADASSAFRRADQGDRLGFEDRVEGQTFGAQNVVCRIDQKMLVLEHLRSPAARLSQGGILNFFIHLITPDIL